MFKKLYILKENIVTLISHISLIQGGWIVNKLPVRYGLKFMYDSFGYTILSVKEKSEYCRCKT